MKTEFLKKLIAYVHDQNIIGLIPRYICKMHCTCTCTFINRLLSIYDGNICISATLKPASVKCISNSDTNSVSISIGYPPASNLSRYEVTYTNKFNSSMIHSRNVTDLEDPETTDVMSDLISGVTYEVEVFSFGRNDIRSSSPSSEKCDTCKYVVLVSLTCKHHSIMLFLLLYIWNFIRYLHWISYSVSIITPAPQLSQLRD